MNYTGTPNGGQSVSSMGLARAEIGGVQRGVHVELDVLEKEVATLHEAVNAAEQRLSPVVTPTPAQPSTAGKADGSPVAARSAVGARVRDLAEGLAQARRRLQQLIDAVEV